LRGRFISFEGCEGCGKSTQIQHTADWLVSCGIQVCATFEPGDGILGKEIRHLLLSKQFRPVAGAELMLFLADRAQHVHETILPALDEGKWILCDRYSDSTVAYQMAGRGIESGEISPLIRFAESGCRPDLSVWLDMPVEDALSRMRQRSAMGEERNRLDDEALHFHQRVRDGYEKISRREPERIYRVNAAGGIADVQGRIRSIFVDRFADLQ